jgi:putative ubiquitin-RnfH superfamily antitoxin RatB of RatAB toxin-antitoxin module
MPSCAARASCTVADATIRVEVAYAERARQTLIALEVPAGTSAREAVERSGIRARHPGIPADAAFGIFGRSVGPGEVLAAGDRVELYRPLPADPKDRRRRLAREGRTMAGRGRAP